MHTISTIWGFKETTFSKSFLLDTNCDLDFKHVRTKASCSAASVI